MEAAVVLLAVAVVALAVQLARSEAQLRAIARFLVNRESASNARVALSVRTRGFVQLAQAVNRQIDRHQGERVAAEEAKRELRRGLTYLSHDIRTPLAGAQGYAQLLAAEEDEALRARYLDVVSRRLDDVGGLLDQLYAYAQVQDPDHRLEREPVDASQVLVEALVADSNADALARIFRNLAVNALRYGCEPPRIVQEGRTVAFANRVADPDGVDAERLFERFYQGDAARGGGGSGLGLAIVAQLARALRIEATARLDGDVLTVELGFPE